MNSICITGRLTKNPEIIPSDKTTIAKFTVANDVMQKSYFFDCAVFGKKADYVSQYVQKGDLVAIEGTITYRDYVRKDGTNGKSYEIACNSVDKLSSKKNADGENAAPTNNFSEEGAVNQDVGLTDDSNN
jgi:single-strand DNA-binding protein